METMLWMFIHSFMLIGGISVIVGLDLRKWYSWLIGLYGFVAGLVLCYLLSDMKNGLLAGTFFASFTLFCGAMSRYHRYRWQAHHDRLDPQKYHRLTKLTKFYRRIFRLDK